MKFRVEVPGRTENSRTATETVEADYWRITEGTLFFFLNNAPWAFKAYAKGYWKTVL